MTLGIADIGDITGVLDSASALAADMLALVHDELLVQYRFMSRPLAQLPARTRMDIRTCCTDARTLSFSPGFVLQSFENARPLLARTYLHMTLHCLLRHPFPPEGADLLRWSCAADAAVCALLGQLESPAISVPDPERDVELARLLEHVGQPTAPEFYALFGRMQTEPEELVHLSMLFGMDMHDPWAPSELPSADDPDASGEPSEDLQQLKEHWEKIARQTEMDLQREQAGSEDQSLTISLSRVESQAMGLDELLRQFAAPSEVIQVNPDEFDYVYYTYGLATYGNIPLVEPLEYCESPHVRDFVVAIDTSGSVDQKLVELFVARACGMLVESGTVGAESRVRIMQCDMRLQDEQLLKSAEDVRTYLDDLEIRGRGGTDFRPVFDRVDELVADGGIADMSGLVYFTDGQGAFPDTAPSYDVAVVFVDKLGPAPSWATSVLAYSDELKGQS